MEAEPARGAARACAGVTGDEVTKSEVNRHWSRCHYSDVVTPSHAFFLPLLPQRIHFFERHFLAPIRGGVGTSGFKPGNLRPQ